MIHCPECRKVMEHQLTLGHGGHEYQLYTCDTCKVRCAVETQFYYDDDCKAETRGEHEG